GGSRAPPSTSTWRTSSSFPWRWPRARATGPHRPSPSTCAPSSGWRTSSCRWKRHWRSAKTAPAQSRCGVVGEMLEDLDLIDWGALLHAYGPATETPDELRALLSPKADKRASAL